MDGDFSIQSPRRIGSAILCCPRIVFIWRNSWNGVLSPMVTLWNSPRRSSSSERPARFSMASLRSVYGSCSGTDSRISAISTTIDGGQC